MKPHTKGELRIAGLIKALITQENMDELLRNAGNLERNDGSQVIAAQIILITSSGNSAHTSSFAQDELKPLRQFYLHSLGRPMPGNILELFYHIESLLTTGSIELPGEGAPQ